MACDQRHVFGLVEVDDLNFLAFLEVVVTEINITEEVYFVVTVESVEHARWFWHDFLVSSHNALWSCGIH